MSDCRRAARFRWEILSAGMLSYSSRVTRTIRRLRSAVQLRQAPTAATQNTQRPLTRARKNDGRLTPREIAARIQADLAGIAAWSLAEEGLPLKPHSHHDRPMGIVAAEQNRVTMAGPGNEAHGVEIGDRRRIAQSLESDSVLQPCGPVEHDGQ